MTVMVIGGSGFIGSRVLSIMAKSEVDAISCDVQQSNSSKWAKLDIFDLPATSKIFGEYRADTVIHLVGLPAVEECQKNPQLSFLLNVLSVQNTLEAMRLTDVERIIFASSATIYGTGHAEPINEAALPSLDTVYSYHKFCAEQAIESYNKSYGLHYVIFRLFNVYGGNPYGGKDIISIFIRKALKRELLTVKGPRKFRDFVHVDDVAKVFASATTKETVSNSVINVGSGVKMSLRQLAEIVKRYFPDVEVKNEEAADDGLGWYGDISLARNLLRFSPVNPMKGISAHVAHYSLKGEER
jgi:UDP-glucose 4-epimerase